MTWEEVAAAVDAGDPRRLVFEMPAVLDRVAQHGDLFAAVLTQRQELQSASAPAPALGRG